MTRQRRISLERHSGTANKLEGRQEEECCLWSLIFLYLTSAILAFLPFHMCFDFPCLHTFIHACSSFCLESFQPLLLFHHSLLFLMNSYTYFRVQLKCQHYYIVLPKHCPNPVPHGHGSWSFSPSPLHVSDDISIILLPSDDNGFPLNCGAGVLYSTPPGCLVHRRTIFWI